MLPLFPLLFDSFTATRPTVFNLVKLYLIWDNTVKNVSKPKLCTDSNEAQRGQEQQLQTRVVFHCCCS